MKYWVYINDKVDGPYEGEKLVMLQGFTPDTLICSEEAASNGSQQWVKASSVFEFEQEPGAEGAAQNGGLDAAAAAMLLEKLDFLTKEISNLHSKLESMESHIDQEFETSRAQQREALQAVAPAIAAPAKPAAPFAPVAPTSSEAQTPASVVPTPAPVTETNIQPQEESATEKLQTQEPAEEPKAEPAKEEVAEPAKKEEEETQTPDETEEDDLLEKTSEEDELVIRSALDSLYNAKLLDDDAESTFQDLLTPKQAKDLAKEAEKAQQEAAEAAIEAAKEEIQQEKESAQEEQPVAQESVEENVQPVTEPAEEKAQEPAEEPVAQSVTPAEKEDFLNTFKNSSDQNEDTLSQIIKERQATQEKEELNIAPFAAAAAGAAAVAGIAALGEAEEQPAKPQTPEDYFVSREENEKVLDLTLKEEQQPVAIATDKENPSHLESVLPAEEMPQDNPQPEVVTEEPPAATLPSLSTEILPPEEQPAQPEEEPKQPETTAQQPGLVTLSEIGDIPAPEKDSSSQEEGALQELVPGAKMEAPTDALITEEDLREAFTERIASPTNGLESFEDDIPAAKTSTTATPTEEPVAKTEQSPLSETSAVANPLEGLNSGEEEMRNPNELTEVELKAGSTYLISDYVPPSQAEADLPKPVVEVPPEPIVEDKTIEIQDMLSLVTETATAMPNEDIANTLKTTKRGASFDIKTVPMVQEPAQSERLKIEGFDDINAQHDIKSADTKSSGSSKLILMVVGGILLVVVAYVALAFLNILPQKLNLLSKKEAPAAVATTKAPKVSQPAPATNVSQPTPKVTEPSVTEEPETAQQPSLDNILAEVKQFSLSNGQPLQQLIESQHAAVSPEAITWDISTAVEPDNYSILVKVPLGNPQDDKKAYRFNYNAVTKTLDPTISDAKNLLDSINS